jgi:peptide chain release factor 2
MPELMNQIKEMQERLIKISELLNIPQKKQKILELEDKRQEPDFWQRRGEAKKLSQKLAELRQEVEELENIEQQLSELFKIVERLPATANGSLKKEIEEKLERLRKEFEKIEFKATFSGAYDSHDAILAIHAGTGGTDAQDWAGMLERMYLRYLEKRRFKVNVLDRQVGGEAGIKSVIFEVLGRYAYGYLKSEAGVHRLVRISPFDAEKMRHTSFALVEVLPEMGEKEVLELKENDLEVETFRSSGHGGQSVNKTDSAVRIKHKPTGLTVTCQNERSQYQNKVTALKILKSRLKQYFEAEQEEERKKLRGEFTEAAWGNQIRSYVIHPYKMVKDHRTGYETQDVNAVLDGELEGLVEEYLKKIQSSNVKLILFVIWALNLI